jgi:putative transposase
VVRQCQLLAVNRASYYYTPLGESAYNQQLMRLLDEQYTKTPFYGRPRRTAWLPQQGDAVNHKRVERLMEGMGLQAISPKPNLSKPAPGHRIYPYLLRDTKIARVDQVWSCDSTYISRAQGFIYLMAVIDWLSRYVLSWSVSISLETDFCREALEAALRRGKPEICNTDQGSQFTSDAFTGRLQHADIAIRMDGRGRALDNICIERLWRTVKYEEVYLKSYPSVPEAKASLRAYLRFYNEERLRQSLGYSTPAAIYAEARQSSDTAT